MDEELTLRVVVEKGTGEVRKVHLEGRPAVEDLVDRERIAGLVREILDEFERAVQALDVTT